MYICKSRNIIFWVFWVFWELGRLDGLDVTDHLSKRYQYQYQYRPRNAGAHLAHPSNNTHGGTILYEDKRAILAG